MAKSFLFSDSALDAFKLLKCKLRESSLQSFDELLPFVVECDTLDVTISATLNQGGPQLPLCLKLCRAAKKYYLTFEKKATVVIEAVKKWSHLLSRQTFTLITEQRFVAFLLDSRRPKK